MTTRDNEVLQDGERLIRSGTRLIHEAKDGGVISIVARPFMDGELEEAAPSNGQDAYEARTRNAWKAPPTALPDAAVAGVPVAAGLDNGQDAYEARTREAWKTPLVLTDAAAD